MSVEFRAVRKNSLGALEDPLFDGLDISVASGAHVGVLGAQKTGKSTLLRMICGTEPVDDGFVERTSRVSWPIPLNSFLIQTSSVATNIRFVGRIYGITDNEFPRRIAELGAIADFLNVKLQKCPRFVTVRLAFALGVGIDCDLYLFDERIIPPDKDFREHAAKAVERLKEQRGFIVATKIPAEVEAHCDSVYVLENGRAGYFPNAAEGVVYFKELMKAAQKRSSSEAAGGPESDDEGGVAETGDIDMIGAAL
jgi:capsular polysaccharide transport system ATP-binding protein